MAEDLGGNFHRVPAAVLRPRSKRDVANIVRFANRRGLKIAMRGQGHSQYGQSLVAGGIVIDSRSLNGARLRTATSAEVQPGASWEEVTRATLTRNLTPPAMGDSMSLSVGGILSAGGISNSSHRAGAVVDNVDELDVVTGAGDLVTCSPTRNRELFDMALGGMGQCSLIVGARLRLVQAPRYVVRRDLDYDDLETFLADHRRIATEGKVEHLGAYILRGADSGWAFRINIGKFSQSPDRADFGDVEGGLRFSNRHGAVAMPYRDYLHREAGRNAVAAELWSRIPSRRLHLAMFLPASRSESFVREILAAPHDTEGMMRFSLYALPARKFARPMFVLPEEDLALNIFLLRSVPIAEEERCRMLAGVVRTIAERNQAALGKAYPPYAPFYTRTDWERHYGPALWKRLATAKKAFDPNSVLTPGTDMFGPGG